MRSRPKKPVYNPLFVLRDVAYQHFREEQEFVLRLNQEFEQRKKLHDAALAEAAAKHARVRETAQRVFEAEERRLEALRKEHRRLDDEAREIARRTQELKELTRKKEENVRAGKALAKAEAEAKAGAQAEINARAEAERAQARIEELERRLTETTAALERAVLQRIEESEAAQRATTGQQASKSQDETKAKAMYEDAQNKIESLEQQLILSPSALENPGIENTKSHSQLSQVKDQVKQAQAQSEPQEATSAQPQKPTLDLPADGSFQAKPAKHQRYLEIHQFLKKLRNGMVSSAKENAQLKTKVGDGRREIRKSIGQITEGKGTNRVPLHNIMTVLRQARDDDLGPKCDIRFVLLDDPTSALPAEPPTDFNVPALFLYALNILAKAVISQFVNEAGVSPKNADPVGVVAMQIFAANEFRWREISLIDILIAKFHVVCPVLFGVNGNEMTEKGKQQLGWWREEKGGRWLTEQRHNERMTGLGAGYAAISLRNFSKSRHRNPYPNWNYWQAMQTIVNVPPQEATRTHFIVLKAMVENYEDRFIACYGHAALAALRKALVDFPNQVPDKNSAVGAVAVLPDKLKKDKRLTLGGYVPHLEKA